MIFRVTKVATYENATLRDFNNDGLSWYAQNGEKKKAILAIESKCPSADIKRPDPPELTACKKETDIIIAISIFIYVLIFVLFLVAIASNLFMWYKLRQAKHHYNSVRAQDKGIFQFFI